MQTSYVIGYVWAPDTAVRIIITASLWDKANRPACSYTRCDVTYKLAFSFYPTSYFAPINASSKLLAKILHKLHVQYMEAVIHKG
jgi:hypothetical protein